MKNVQKAFQMFWDTFGVPVKDLRVLGWIFILGIIAFFCDPEGMTYMRTIIFVLFFWHVALAVRKIFFPYRQKDEDGKRVQLKMSDLVKSALHEKNTAAAIVVTAYAIFMICVAYSFIYWIRG